MKETLDVGTVTGVDMRLPVAGIGGRSYAFIIDWHIRFLVALAWFLLGHLVFFAGSGLDGGLFEAPTSYQFVVVLPTFIIYFLYHPIVELMMKGRTPGKRMAGVSVVTVNGSVPNSGAILLRNLFRLIDSLPVGYLLGLGTVMFSKNQVRIGDMAAGTLLVYTQSEKDTTKGLESAVTEDGPSVRHTELIREVLERWPQLDYAARVTLSKRLLQQVAPDQRMPHGMVGDEVWRVALEQALAGKGKA